MKRLLLTATASNHLQSNSLDCICCWCCIFFRVIFESLTKKGKFVCQSKKKKSQLKHIIWSILQRVTLKLNCFLWLERKSVQQSFHNKTKQNNGLENMLWKANIRCDFHHSDYIVRLLVEKYCLPTHTDTHTHTAFAVFFKVNINENPETFLVFIYLSGAR